jgi:beta-fructofuranosidase
MAHQLETAPLPSRTLLAHEPHRPQYHFLPPANWMNDPNGLIQWNGRFHLFYQYNPHAPVWGTIHWGHAMSDDLVHWKDLPIALAPTPGSVDEYGVFSGCAVDNGGVPTLIYTGVRKPADGPRIELPCLATSSDPDLRSWDKHPANPVISAPPDNLDVLGFRDHSVWREGDSWFQLIGSGIRDVGGTALLYRSPDLVHWEYLGPLCIGNPVETGRMWECPDLFRLGERHVLMVSPIPLRKTLYFSGHYRQHRFTPEYQGVVDDGGYFYAPQSFTDDQSRRIMFGWLWEGRDEAAQRAGGWAGVMSLPRVLSARSDGRLGMEPAPEIARLRGRHTGLRDIRLDRALPLDFGGAALEIVAELSAGTSSQVGINLRRAPEGREETVIVYDSASRFLAIDRARSSLDPATQREPHGTHLALGDDEPLRLRVFVDHSVLEVFANGQACLSSRIYPSRPDSLGVEVFARSGTAHLQALEVWEMGSIWPRSG